MRELHDVGETHGGKRLAERPARRRQRGEFRVGGRQDDDVARGLTEVDGLAAVGDDTRLGLEKVHWSVEREVAMPNGGLSVTSRIVVSAPDSRLESSPLPTPQAGSGSVGRVGRRRHPIFGQLSFVRRGAGTNPSRMTTRGDFANPKCR